MPCGHPCECPTYRDHVATISFSAKSMPTRKPQTVATIERERRWDADMPAYKNLRRDGLQPKGIDGAAELETRATVPAEIETSHISAEPKLYQQVHEELAS